MHSLVDARLPGKTACFHSASRKQFTRTVTQAGKREKSDEGTGKGGGGLFGGLFGQGTQRLRVGRQGAEGGPKGRQSAPPGGTKRLKTLPKKQGGGPGGLFQRIGSQAVGKKDPNTVFVAGATGRLGLRIVRELLLAGFKVRAGARNTDKAQEYADLALSLGVVSPDAAKRLQIVAVDLEEEDTIVAAIGNAGKVVQAIGAAENNVLDFGAPKRIDGDAAINLVDAAVEVGVEQFVMVTSLGTGKFGWPAGALNLFGGILIQKRRAEKALEQSGLQYVIVRPGGMERPTDDYKRTNNVRLQTRDKLFGGLVSRLQVAELVSAAVANPSLAENKILEVVAETDAPLLDYEVLLEQQPSEASQEARQRERETKQEASSRVADAEEELEEAREAAAGAEALVQQLQDALKAKKASVGDAQKGPTVRDLKKRENELERAREVADENDRRQQAAKAVLNAAKAAQREGRTLTRQQISDIEDPILSSASQTEAKAAAPAKPKGRWGFPSKQQEGIAEGVANKEINLKLGKEDPKPSEADEKLAEGIAQKEIAIASGKEESTRGWFGRLKGPKDSPAQQPTKEAPKPAAKTQQPAAAPQPAKPRQFLAVKPKERETSPEEVQRLSEARQKSSEARASREADFLARLDAERSQEAQKKAQAAEKKAADARKKLQDERKATAAKLEAAAKKEAESKAPAVGKKVKEVAPPKAAPPKAASSSASDKEALAKAKENARDARQWIEGWRSEQGGKSTSSSSNGSGSTAQTAPAKAAPTKADSGRSGSKGTSGVPENVAEAKEWIRDWRARSLETKLPQNSPANK